MEKNLVVRVSRLAIILAIILVLTSILWVPALVLAVADSYDRYEYYLKALEYLLLGLEKYFDAVIELFKAACGL